MQDNLPSKATTNEPSLFCDWIVPGKLAPDPLLHCLERLSRWMTTSRVRAWRPEALVDVRREQVAEAVRSDLEEGGGEGRGEGGRAGSELLLAVPQSRPLGVPDSFHVGIRPPFESDQ